jgi:glycosyltransferase involved in cell wall biosynthesis
MMRPLRVLQIVNSIAIGGPVGGAERFGVALARALDRTQIQPLVAALWNWEPGLEASWQRLLAGEGIPAVVGPAKDDRQPLRNFIDAIRTLLRAVPAPVDIIHSQCDFGDIAALLLRRRLGARYVVRTAHNEREWAKRPWRRIIFTNGVYPLSYAAELGVSQQVVDNLDRRPLARLLRRRGIVAHNALDFGRFTHTEDLDRSVSRRSLEVPLDACVVGTVGRLVPQKGLHVLLLAAKAVLTHRPDICFLIVGGGELADSLREEAQQLGISDRVRFTGVRQNVEEILAALDLFVSSSLWEGLPTAILEAMAAQVPVIATRVSGTVELVQDGVTGVLVEPGDPMQLAEAILAQAASPESSQLMATRARAFVLAHFDIKVVARQHEAIYRQLMEVL